MALSLSHAFLEQAKSDYSSFVHLRNDANQPSSQWLHFLQMTLEKTAKAYLAAAGTDYDQLRQSHFAFCRFLRILPRNPAIPDNLGMHSKAFKQQVSNIAHLVDEIEQLVPRRGHDGPTAEYPWKNPRGEIFAPCEYDFRSIVSQMNTARGRNLLKILQRGLFDEVWQSSLGIG